MTMSPFLWGAGLACALGGAIAGNALGSTPAIDRSTIQSFYQSHEDGGGYEPATDAEQLPDHYPLETNHGTVPVAALSERGLYSQARYRSFYEVAPPQLAYEPDIESALPREEVSDASLRIGDPAPEPAATLSNEAVPPLQLAQGPASLTSGGGAKMIDVQATLAMR